MSGGGLVDADTPQLATEAANFDRIAGDLKSVLAQVESTGASLAANMDNAEAGRAAIAALARFQEAATQQNTLLTEISQNIHVSSQKYEGTDAQNSQSIQTTMNSVL